MHKLTIRRVGNSLGTTFPKEILDKLKISQGDTLFVIETPNGIELTPYQKITGLKPYPLGYSRWTSSTT